MPTALSCQVVIESGAVTPTAPRPDPSVVRSVQSHVSGKNWRTRWTSARSPADFADSTTLSTRVTGLFDNHGLNHSFCHCRGRHGHYAVG